MQFRQSNLIYKKLVKLHKNPGEQVVVTRFITRDLEAHHSRGGIDCVGCTVTCPLPSEGDMLPLTQMTSNYVNYFSFQC